jgi:hypothetical protein
MSAIEWEVPDPPAENMAKFLSNWNLALVAMVSAGAATGPHCEKASRLARVAVSELFPVNFLKRKELALSLLRRRASAHDAYRALWHGGVDA